MHGLVLSMVCAINTELEIPKHSWFARESETGSKLVIFTVIPKDEYDLTFYKHEPDLASKGIYCASRDSDYGCFFDLSDEQIKAALQSTDLAPPSILEFAFEESAKAKSKHVIRLKLNERTTALGWPVKWRYFLQERHSRPGFYLDCNKELRECKLRAWGYAIGWSALRSQGIAPIEETRDYEIAAPVNGGRSCQTKVGALRIGGVFLADIDFGGDGCSPGAQGSIDSVFLSLDQKYRSSHILDIPTVARNQLDRIDAGQIISTKDACKSGIENTIQSAHYQLSDAGVSADLDVQIFADVGPIVFSWTRKRHVLVESCNAMMGKGELAVCGAGVDTGDAKANVSCMDALATISCAASPSKFLRCGLSYAITDGGWAPSFNTLTVAEIDDSRYLRTCDSNGDCAFFGEDCAPTEIVVESASKIVRPEGTQSELLTSFKACITGKSIYREAKNGGDCNALK